MKFFNEKLLFEAIDQGDSHQVLESLLNLRNSRVDLAKIRDSSCQIPVCNNLLHSVIDTYLVRRRKLQNPLLSDIQNLESQHVEIFHAILRIANDQERPPP